MRTLLLALPLCGACGMTSRGEPPVAPDVAIVDVLSALDEAVDRAAAGDPEATEAWSRALAGFERSLEPSLRQQLDPTEVVATEYAFARIRRALDEGRDAGSEVDALGARLQKQLAQRTIATR
jgi:hypothetical protein